MSEETGKLNYQGKEYSLPIFFGRDQKPVLDLRKLYEETGLLAYDPFLHNTAIVQSAVTYIDSDKGMLYYRGYDVEELVEKSSFVEVAYLLMHGDLPKKEEYKTFSSSLSNHSMIHESMHNFFYGFSGNANPLAILATMVTALSSYYPHSYEEHISGGTDIKERLISKVRTLAAWAYKKHIGHPIVYPSDQLSYCANFLNMMFSVPAEDYHVFPEHERLLNQLLILYSDHEQSIATSTVRLVGSSQANLFVCVNAGISALWGAREAAYELQASHLLKTILARNIQPEQFFEKFINGEETLLSPAFGHKKYQGMGPRAKISRRLLHEYIKLHPETKKKGLIRVALEVEKFALGHPYFAEKGRLPNLDFYSTPLFNIIGIPESMLNVVRVIGKLSGWLAHWEEQRKTMEEAHYFIRPQQVYSGESARGYIPITERS